MADESAPYQSLYRRFRPQRFSEVLGQDHVTRALRNAVREGRVGHGYLFSGPRGTGKTSTARILAKALNCEKLDDGEPCGVCDSCVSVQQGNSFAVFEMDAASNRGIDAIRDLIQRIALGGPGHRKVYIIDEVHHLTTDAATALLKTLEEPPGHVVFVLATTDPQKVLPTIKSRVQHYEFHLLQTDVLQSLVSSVNAEAGLGLETGDLERVVRRGAGSARDALSVLDQAAALGEVDDEVPVASEVTEALCTRDPGRALAAVAEACGAGRDPRRMGEEILAHLRDVFLATRAPSLLDASDDDRARIEDQGKRLGPAALVRAMERLGESLAEMREALDARVTLEVALVRITAPEADTSVAALLERIERLERRLEGGAGATSPAAAPAVVTAPPAVTAPAAAPADPTPDAPVAPRADGPPVRRPATKAVQADTTAAVAPPPPPPSRGALGAYRKQGQGTPPAPAGPASTSEQATSTPQSVAPTATPGAGDLPSRDELTLAWGDVILGGLRGRAKALFAVGRFVGVEHGRAVFALPNEAHRTQCLSSQKEVEAAIAAHFGRAVPLHLVVDDAPGELSGERTRAGADVPDDDVTASDFREMRDAPGGPSTPAERVKLAFPGAVEVEDA